MFDELGDATAPVSQLADPDGDLVARIANGERDAAALLMDRHADRIMRLASRMLGDDHEAEDIVQDVFLKVWKNASRWRPGEAKFSTWLHRVALNLCYDRLRRRRETPTDAPPELADDGPGPDRALDAQDAARIVRAALAALPKRQSAAIVMCHYGEASNIEAARAMNISVEALESLLARGRRNLRAWFEKQDTDIL